MENAGGVPHVLQYNLNSMAAVSYNSFSISPSTGTANVLPNGQIRYQLPNSSLLDMKTSKMTFSVKTSGSCGARLPPVSQLFSRIEVKAGGVTIYNGSNFNHIVENVKVNMGVKKVCGVTGHKDFLDGADATGDQLAAGVDETYHARIGTSSNLFAIDLGEFSEIQPRLLDTSLLPQLEIILTVNTAACLSSIISSTAPRGTSTNAVTLPHASAQSATFEIIRPTMHVNMYSLGSGAYAQAIRSRMADVGYLSLCYENTLVFNQAWTGSARFSLSAMSLKRLTAVFRRQAAASTIKAAIPIVGGATSDFDGKGAVYSIYGSSYANNAGVAEYQTAGEQYSLPTTVPAAEGAGEIQSGAAFDYSATTSVDLQWKIQSALVPNYACDVASQAELTKHAYNVDEFAKARLPVQFLYNYHAFGVPLNIPETPLDKKTISGLNTQSTNAFIELTSSGANRDVTNYDCFILACTDNILRVGEGKAIEVIS